MSSGALLIPASSVVPAQTLIPVFPPAQTPSTVQWVNNGNEALAVPRLPWWAYEPEPTEAGIDPQLVVSGRAASALPSYVSDVSQTQYVPAGDARLRLQTTKRSVPCGLELKETPTTSGARPTLQQECRTATDAVTGQTAEVCTWTRQGAPKKLEYQPLECDEEEVRALQGYNVQRRVVQDGDVRVQNIVTPQVGVVKRLGPPHPAGKPLPISRVVTPDQYALEQALDAAAPAAIRAVAEAEAPELASTSSRSSSRGRSRRSSRARSTSRRSRSRSRSRSSRAGGSDGRVGGAQYYAVRSDYSVPNASNYFVPAASASPNFVPASSTSYFVPSSSSYYLPSSSSSSPSYYLPSAAAVQVPSSLLNYGSVQNYGPSFYAMDDTYGVGAGPLGLPYTSIQQTGFPFNFRNKPLSVTEYPSYWRWLASLDKEMGDILGIADASLYGHRADEKLDTIATLEAYILAGVARATSKGYLVNANKILQGGAAYRNLMNPEFAALAAGSLATPWNDLTRGGTILAVQTYTLGWRFKPIEAGDADAANKTGALNDMKAIQERIAAGAVGRPFETTALPAVKIPPQDVDIFGVREAELLAQLARLQYVGSPRVTVNTGKKDGDVDLKTPADRLIAADRAKYIGQLADYLRIFQRGATDDLFSPVTGTVAASSSASFYYSSPGTYYAVRQPSNPPRVINETIYNAPQIRYANVMTTGGGKAPAQPKPQTGGLAHARAKPQSGLAHARTKPQSAQAGVWPHACGRPLPTCRTAGTAPAVAPAGTRPTAAAKKTASAGPIATARVAGAAIPATAPKNVAATVAATKVQPAPIAAAAAAAKGKAPRTAGCAP